MSKKITIADDVYLLLASLKEGPDDSFTNVIRRHICLEVETGPRVENGRELYEIYRNLPPPNVDAIILKLIRKREQKSNRLK